MQNNLPINSTMSCVTAEKNPVPTINHYFHTPTNQASNIIGMGTFGNTEEKARSPTMPLFAANNLMPIWLPVSTGDIKKTAQTRFVNSSPKSYRLMPASVESSEADRTSFVEKSSHKFLLPVSYFLEVAKLWALSNRSELECQFTQAKTEGQLKPTSSKKEQSDSDDCRPICHAKATTDAAPCPWSVGDTKTSIACATTAEQDLLSSINRFLESCRRKDKCMAGGAGIPNQSQGIYQGLFISKYYFPLQIFLNCRAMLEVKQGDTFLKSFH